MSCLTESGAWALPSKHHCRASQAELHERLEPTKEYALLTVSAEPDPCTGRLTFVIRSVKAAAIGV